MSYLVLARKWRPLTFDQMVGQEFIARTLQNALRSGRVAHAFLFAGPRGVGKTSVARILAKSLNCDKGPTPEPCNQCVFCREITEGRSLDVYEIDGASNTSVDDVRELRENVKYMARPGKKRIYIIDEVHMLSKSAFNALLKTLEEPPEHVVFIFATTEPHKVPDTIQSRCQRYDFRRIPRARIQQRLEEIAASESIQVGETALAWIAKAADGSMRDAQSLLDQMISYCGQTILDDAVMEILGLAGRDVFFRISEAVLDQDPAGCIRALDEVYRVGYDLGPFYQDLVEHFRNLLIASIHSDPASMLQMADGEIEDLRKQAAKSSPEDLRRIVSLLIRAEKDILRSSLPRIGLEVTLIKMAHLARLEPLPEILQKVLQLERSFETDRLPPNRSSPDPVAGRIPREPLRTAPAKPSERGVPSPGRPPFQKAEKKEPPQGTPTPKQTDDPSATQAQSASPEAIKDFIDAVESESPRLAALVEKVDRWEISPSAITAFCASGSFHFDQLRPPEVQATLTRVARRCFSPTFSFEIRPLMAARASASPEPGVSPKVERGRPPASGNKGEPKKSQRDEEARSSPGVKTAIELFRGKITDVKILGPGDKD